MKSALILVIFSCFILAQYQGKFLSSQTSNNRTKVIADEPVQSWGYVDVRPNAKMFWWLYQAFETINAPSNGKPLVIWLQGGPGASSTGFGNFGEIGPLDANLNSRNQTWLNHANLLFIDNPVGTGYSYVTDDSAYVTDNEQIAKDLVTLIKQFFEKKTEFSVSKFFTVIICVLTINLQGNTTIHFWRIIRW